MFCQLNINITTRPEITDFQQIVKYKHEHKSGLNGSDFLQSNDFCKGTMDLVKTPRVSDLSVKVSGRLQVLNL